MLREDKTILKEERRVGKELNFIFLPDLPGRSFAMKFELTSAFSFIFLKLMKIESASTSYYFTVLFYDVKGFSAVKEI